MVVIKRVENLETYLKELLDKPIYLHKKVLEFLNIQDQDKTPFLTYFDFFNRKNIKKKLN